MVFKSPEAFIPPLRDSPINHPQHKHSMPIGYYPEFWCRCCNSYLNYPTCLFSLLLSEGLCQWQQRTSEFSQESGSLWDRSFPELTVDEEDIFSVAGPEEVAGLAAVGAIVCLVE